MGRRSTEFRIMGDLTRPFNWRQCRSIGFRVGLWVWPWLFCYGNSNDQFGGMAFINLGPIEFQFNYAVSRKMAEKLSGL